MLLISFALACAMMLAGLGFMSVLRSAFKVEYEKSLLNDTAIGAGGFSFLIMLFGVLRWFSGTGKLALLGLCILFALAGLYRLIFGLLDIYLRRRQANEKKPAAFLAEKWLSIALLIILGGLVLVAAAAPPAMDDWDTLAYHLTAPKMYIEHGGIYYIDFYSHSNFPMLTEMLYIPALMLGNMVGAKLIHFLYGVLMVLVVIRLAHRQVKGGSGYLAGIIAAGVPIVMWEATTAYIDLAAALYTILAADILLEIYGKKKTYAPLFAGLCAGFAASTKLLGAAVVLFGALWIVYITWQKRNRMAGMLVQFVIGACICLPWYIRSLVYTGNPVYPFFYSIFGGRNWNSELAELYSTSQAKFGMGHGIIDLILAPYNLAVHPERFYDTAGLFVGPIVLIGILVMFVLIKYRNRKTLGLAGFILAQILLWFVLTQQSRYLIPVYALMAALTAGLVYSMESVRSLKTGVWVIFVAVALFGGYTVFGLAVDRHAVAFGGESAENYLRRSVDTYSATQYINENTPEDVKIALFGDTRGLYLDRDFAWCDWGHNAQYSKDFEDETQLAEFFSGQGFTHALVNLNFLSPEHNGPIVAQAIMEGKLRRIFPVFDMDAKVGVYVIEK